jgi:hypothetical protein
MTPVRIDSFAPSELRAFVGRTQGSAEPPPRAKFYYAFGVPSVVGVVGAPGVPGAPGVLRLRPVVRNSGSFVGQAGVPGIVGDIRVPGVTRRSPYFRYCSFT